VGAAEPQARRRPLRRALSFTIRWVALLFLLGVGWLVLVWPPPSWWRTHWPNETAFMAMRARQLRAAGDATPRSYQPVPLDSIADWMPRAATAAEDDAFWTHPGLDYRAIREALGYRRESFSWSNPRDRAELARAFRVAWERPERLRGASTITQQLAKNLYLSPSRNPLRKLKEAVIAYRLEWALSKDRILELYLNVAELGPNLWGVEAASRRYFGRSAARLSIGQAALLVATLPHPLSSNPAHRPRRAHYRAQLIMRRLLGEDVVVPKEAPEDTLPTIIISADTTAPRADTVPVDSGAPHDTLELPRDTLPAGPRGDPLPPTPRRDTLVPPPRRDTAPAPPPPRDTAARRVVDTLVGRGFIGRSGTVKMLLAEIDAGRA
jgi:monofunctional biosynthetic peptidoglycan transglycosylase